MAEPIITFTSGAGWYGVRAREVLEVASLGGVRPVPQAPGIVAGLAEVHGRIVTFIDLDRLLETGAGAAGPRRFGVVLAPPRDHLGVLVRSEVDVAPPCGESSVPDGPGDGGLLLARLPVGDRLLNLLHLPALVARVEEAIRGTFRRGDSTAEGVV